MKRKQNNLIADIEQVLVWVEGQSGHIFPLAKKKKKSLIQSKTLYYLQFIKSERSEEVAEIEASRDWLLRFKERRCHHNIKYRVKQQVLI